MNTCLLYASWIGFAKIRLGNIDEGLTWLESASDKREFFVTSILNHPFTRGLPDLDGNLRFQSLLKKMNLDDASINKLKERGPL